MKLITAFLLAILIFIGYFHPISSITQDLGRHLITGEIILKTHSVPKINLFSYTYTNFPFINHHWLSEVLYSIIYKITGFDGLLIFNTILILLSFGLIFSSAYKKAGSFSILFCFLLYVPILFERTDLRPELFSFLFLVIFIAILYKFRTKFTRLIFFLPLTELLWVNMHIYFPIGIAVVLFFFLDYLFLKKFKIDQQVIILGAVLLLTTFVTLINPNGIKGALYPFFVFQNYGYSIEENQNIFFLWNIFHQQSILFFFIAGSIFWTCLLLNFKKIFLAEWLISIFFTIFASISIRNFPLFIFATIIPFAKACSNFKFALPKYAKTVFFVLLLGLFVFEGQQALVKNGFGLGTVTGAEKGVDFFLNNNFKGPIFNNFDIGSYLDYRLYPEEKVFVDGRPEAYPSSFFQDIYIPMQTDAGKFELVDQQYKFKTIIFSYIDQTPWAQAFLGQISQNKRWHLAYLDDFIAIWTKDANTKPVIKTDYSNIKSLTQLAYFFQNINSVDQEIMIYQNILSLNPVFCPALHNLAVRMQETKNPSFSIFADKFQKYCQ
jgi:hypothetical protein